MLYDDDVMNNVYDYLKKANTYLQFASDKYKSDLLDGTRLVRKCQEKMDEINEELAKMNNAFNLDDSVGEMTLNIGTTLGTEEETEPLFETEFTLEMIYEYIDNADFLTDIQKENAKKDNVVICYFQLLMLLDSRTNEKIATAEDVVKRYEAEMASQDINDPEYSPSSIGLKYQEEINKAYHDLNPDCDPTHVATIGELRECIRVNKMQKIELISTIKENSYNYVYSDSDLVDILAKAEAVGTSEYKYRLLNEEASSSYSKIGEFQELSQMWIYLDSEEKIIFNYLYKKDPNIAFDYLDSKSMKITKIKGATDALIDFKNDGKSDFSIVSGFGTGLFNGVIETIENVMASTSDPTMTSEEYRAMYMAELLSGSFQIQEYSKSDIELMYNSGEIREDVYKVLSDKEIVTDLDISYYSGNMSSAEYKIWEETYPFYQKYIDVNDETTRQKFYSTAYNVGTGVGNYVPIVIASSITSGFVSSFIPALSPAAANTIGRLVGQSIDFRQAYRQHFVQNYYNGYDTEIAAYAALLSASGEVAADVMLDSIPGVSRVTNVSPVNVVKGPKMARIIGNSGLTVLKQLTNAGIGGTTSLAVNKYVSATYLHQPIDFEGTIKELGDMLPQALMTSLIINLPGNIKTFGRDIINYNKGFDVDVQIKPDVEIKSNIDTKNLVDQNILILNDDGTIKEFNLQEVNRAFGYDLKTKMDDYMKKCGLGDYKLTIDYDTPRTNFDYDNRPLFDQEYSIGDTVGIFFGIKDNMLYARLKMPEVYEPNTSLASIGNSSNSTIPLLNSSGDSTSDMSIIPPKIDTDNIPLYGSAANNVSTENNLSVFRNNKIYLNAILSKTVKSAKNGDTTLSLDLDKFSVKAWNEKNKRLLFQNLIPKGIVTNVPNCLKDDPYCLNLALSSSYHKKSIIDSFSREAWNEKNLTYLSYRTYMPEFYIPQILRNDANALALFIKDEYLRSNIYDQFNIEAWSESNILQYRSTVNKLGIPKALQTNFDYLKKYLPVDSSLPEDALVTVIDNCIKANRYDIIEHMNQSLFTNTIAIFIADVADELMIKKLSNNLPILTACLERGRYDLLKYFDKKMFEIQEIRKYMIDHIEDYALEYGREILKIVDSNEAYDLFFHLTNNKNVLISYLNGEIDDNIFKFNSSLFTEDILETSGKKIIDKYGDKIIERYKRNINFLNYCLKIHRYDLLKYFDEEMFEIQTIRKYMIDHIEDYALEYGREILKIVDSNEAYDLFFHLTNNKNVLISYLSGEIDDNIFKFDSSLFTADILETCGKKMIDKYGEKIVKKYKNNIYFLNYCLKAHRYDLLKYFDEKMFEIQAIRKYMIDHIEDYSLEYGREILKIVDSNEAYDLFFHLTNNKNVLISYLTGEIDDNVFNFNSRLFTKEVIDEYGDKIISSISILLPGNLITNQYLLEKCLSKGLIGLAIKFDSSSFTENIIEKYGNEIIDYISINGISDSLMENQYLFRKCLNKFRDDLLKLFAPSLLISNMNELIKLNKTELISTTLKECFDNFDLNLLLQVDDNMLKMFFSIKQMTLIRIGRILNESVRENYELLVIKQLKNGLDIENTSLENIEKIPLLINKIEFSNSLEIKKIETQLLEQLLSVDNPELVIDDVEKIFLLKDIPIVAKLYLTWEKLHPNFNGYNLKNQALSPTLLSFFEAGNLTSAQRVIFSDLLLSALGSNNRSLIEYINDIELGNEIFENLQSGNIKLEELSDKEQEILKTFIYHLNALYNNSDNVRNSYADKNVLTGDLETDLSRLSILFRINRELGENIPDKIVQMFAHDAGFDTIASLKEYMAKKKEEANTRNFKRAYEGTFTVEVGDLVKGLGNRLFDLTIFENILQNGSIAVDYLGADSDTDLTPLDTDLCKIFEIKGSIGETILNTESRGWGPVFAVLKNDGRFQETRKSVLESNQDLTNNVNLRKLESFLTGKRAANHYGIRTGFASSEIDFLVCEKYLARIGFEIARNGIYIPVVDYNGNLVFTPEDYMALRNKMSGLSHYNTGSYQFSPRLVPSEEISLAQKDNREEVQKKQLAILKHFANAISRLGLNIKMAIDGDLVPGTIEIIDTGSTGRYTNKPHDADFDYMLRVDNLIRENINEFMSLSKVLNDALSDRDATSFITAEGYFRFKGVKIPELEERVDIDITFTDRTDRIKYSSDMSLKDRLNTIKEQNSRLYDVVINEIINAKKILKAGGCYKPRHSNAGQDGLGGVGVENWILQNGGSLEDAARSFIEVANNCSTFEEFCKKYQVWDFGENFVSKPKKENNGLLITYLHDEFVSNNMSGDGYLKMQKVLSIYLKYIDMKVSDPIKSTIDEINTWLNN